MTSLVVDKGRDDGRPGTHVLVVGVGAYAELPEGDQPADPAKWNLRSVDSPALSAFRIYQTLTQSLHTFQRPLKTCRLLLSPTLAELAVEPGIGALGVPKATREEFQKAASDWRSDANGDDNNVTIFFYCGHGFQRGPEESILTFSNIFTNSDPPQNKCALFSSIKNGMAPSLGFERIAKTQFYFVDACREVIAAANAIVGMNVPDVFSGLNVADHRAAPAFFSATNGTVGAAWNKRETEFTEALINALKHGADNVSSIGGQTVWPVTAISLKTALDRHFSRKGRSQQVVLSSAVGDPTLIYLKDAPLVEIKVEVSPQGATPCLLEILDGDGITKSSDQSFAGAPLMISAGIYRAQASGTAFKVPYRSNLTQVTQRTAEPWRHDVGHCLVNAGGGTT